MACLNVTFERVSANLTVDFSQICGTDIGEVYLFDSDGKMLLTSDGEYLTAKK